MAQSARIVIVAIHICSGEALNWKRESAQGKERKKAYAEITKVCGQNESSSHEIVKKKKEIHASFAAPLQTANVKATSNYKSWVISA